MKHIDVQQQPVLSFGRTFKIALRGVQYRLFRALVTVAVIAVAMAFLMNILSESLFKRVVAVAVRDEIRAMRQADHWIARLSVPQTAEEIVAVLAAAEPDSETFREMAVFGGLDETALPSAAALAVKAQAYLKFFDDINYGRRRVLIGNATGVEIFERLQNEAAQTRFFESLTLMRAVRFVTTPDAFREFLRAWPGLSGTLTAVRAGQQRAIGNIQQAQEGRTVMEALSGAEGPFGEAVRQAGFVLDPGEAVSLAKQIRLAEHRHFIEDSINNPEVRKAVAARKDVLPGDVSLDMIWKLLGRPATAAWYEGQLAQHASPPPGLDAARLHEVARTRARSKLMVRAELMTMGTGGGFMNIGPRMTWLAFVSMLVCTVGIANAMLMSVTERFREIATLKCLGALDGFIMTVFLIEAAILGLVGGLAGTLIGLVLGLGRMLAVFQSLLIELFPGGLLLQAAGISIVTGIALAAVAAAYPSMRAARLAPMEAMRIE
ncbi:MAG: FtsX-like permease family protein [Verrucomicrobia bacterium]|nr:FtsX-like permease family protein [Verrucomicrobiota bacterium]